MKSIEHLYIIGNGFDLHHGARTLYKDFYNYLLRTDRDVLKAFYLYFGPKSLRNSFHSIQEFLWCLEDHPKNKKPDDTWADKILWNNFEQYLSCLNREKVLDILDARLPKVDVEDENFKSSDYYMPLDEITWRIDDVSYTMKYRFYKWLKTIQYPKGFKKLMLNIDSDASFLNFNYTPFLETVYEVPHENIVYLHGTINGAPDELILGHTDNNEEEFAKWYHKNKNRKRYRPNLKDKRGNYFPNYHLSYLAYFCEDTDNGNWITTSRYYALEEAVGRIEDYFERNRKETAQIIKQHQKFFESLSHLRTITVIGHSLGKVDVPYFEEIIRQVGSKEELQWEFLAYNIKDEEKIISFCRNNQIDRYTIYSYADKMRSSVH